MESLNVVTSMLNSTIKAAQTVNNASEVLTDLNSQIVTFFNAMHQEVTELEQQAEQYKARIAELEAELESLKNKPVIETTSEPTAEPEVL